ncbi:DUF4192 domain-containing protein [Angustibacter sp. McL0619]|uniref:DUF4192 domain-containing protein n=1 Tax=Angustibacter sp. McL0619 TaxID=3415676 RepID=UPI003CF72FD7
MTAETERHDPQLQQPIRLASPADLVGAVPYLVGFTPRHSLVTISLRHPRLRCSLVARVDLPRCSEDVEQVVEELVEHLLADDPEEVAVLIYDDVPWHPKDRPWQDLVDVLELELAVAGVGVREACFIGSDGFWSYSCWEPDCCPDEGTPLAEASCAPAAAALVALGRAPVGDREDLRAQVAAGDRDLTGVISQLADRQWDELVGGDPDDGEARVVRLFADLVARRTDHASAAVPVTAAEAALLVAGLADTVIRDSVAMRWVSWLSDRHVEPAHRSPLGMPGLPPTHDAVTSLLGELARISDGTWAVSPLTLFALQCWHAGDGALANLAIERALRLDAGYRMALLVDGVLRAGISPRGRR